MCIYDPTKLIKPESTQTMVIYILYIIIYLYNLGIILNCMHCKLTCYSRSKHSGNNEHTGAHIVVYMKLYKGYIIILYIF